MFAAGWLRRVPGQQAIRDSIRGLAPLGSDARGHHPPNRTHPS